MKRSTEQDSSQSEGSDFRLGKFRNFILGSLYKGVPLRILFAHALYSARSPSLRYFQRVSSGFQLGDRHLFVIFFGEG